jgi:hypothetical protein
MTSNTFLKTIHFHFHLVSGKWKANDGIKNTNTHRHLVDKTPSDSWQISLAFTNDWMKWLECPVSDSAERTEDQVRNLQGIQCLSWQVYTRWNLVCQVAWQVGCQRLGEIIHTNLPVFSASQGNTDKAESQGIFKCHSVIMLELGC